MDYKYMTKIFEDQTRNTYKCEHCGHSVLIEAKLNKKICGWCKHYVYKSKKEKFKELLKWRLKK